MEVRVLNGMVSVSQGDRLWPILAKTKVDVLKSIDGLQNRGHVSDVRYTYLGRYVRQSDWKELEGEEDFNPDFIRAEFSTRHDPLTVSILSKFLVENPRFARQDRR